MTTSDIIQNELSMLGILQQQLLCTDADNGQVQFAGIPETPLICDGNKAIDKLRPLAMVADLSGVPVLVDDVIEALEAIARTDQV